MNPVRYYKHTKYPKYFKVFEDGSFMIYIDSSIRSPYFRKWQKSGYIQKFNDIRSKAPESVVPISEEEMFLVFL